MYHAASPGPELAGVWRRSCRPNGQCGGLMASGKLRITRSGEILISDVLAAVPVERLDGLRETMTERFVRDNPVYADARRFRRPCRHIPRQVTLFSATEDFNQPARNPSPDLFANADDECRRVLNWHLPRGAEPVIRRLLKEHEPDVEQEWLDNTVRASSGGFRLTAALRDYQTMAVSEAIKATQGVIQAPTGSGKTVIACGLMAATGLNTLFVVHTSVLLEQTVAAIRQFLGVEPGIIGGGRDDPRAVTVAMVQSLARRDLSSLHPMFGMVILDEAHHCPADSFRTIVGGFPAAFRFGLTATPSRKDRLHPVLYDIIGPIIARVDPRNLMISGSITPVEVIGVETAYSTRYTKDYGRLITRIAGDRRRNELVVDAVLRHMGERTLVLSERVDHCEKLKQMLLAAGVRAEVLTGAVARDDRNALLAAFREGTFKVLVSTSSLVGEGFDLPALDTVVLTLPNGNIARTTQMLGRALRPSAGKVAGRIVDFCDSRVSLLVSQFRRRQTVYRKFSIREDFEKNPDLESASKDR